MSSQGDPYRTLGIAPGASLNEIRSAYRRLAKQYHPDFAGERAVPRFLAIQAAYEQLVDGEGHLRGGVRGPAGSSRGSAGRSSGPADPWRANPARARASRDAWRARRSGGGPGPASGSAPGPGSTPGGTGRRTTGSRPAGERPTGERHHHVRRGPRKATPGSTSYDEAAETPLDPAWEGGAWYGPTSGTYWTLNPREYADPRKHGPEYLARARRASTQGRSGGAPAGGPGQAPAEPGPVDAPPRTDVADDAPPGSGTWEWTGTGPTTTDGGATAWGTRDWRFEARDDDGPAWTPGAESRARPAWTAPGDPGADAPAFPDLEALVRRAFPEELLRLLRGPDPRWRLLLALVAWPPIGASLSGLVSAATGCATFSASCPEPVPVLLVAVQPLIVAGLFLFRSLTAVAAFASLAALAVAVPAGAVLSVGALPRPIIEPTVLGVIVAVAYVAAFVVGAFRVWVRRQPGDPGP